MQHDIQAIRNRLVNAGLLVYATFAAPTVIFSLIRSADIGWQNLMTIHITLVATAIVTAICRRFISFRIRALIFLGILFTGGAVGVFVLGLLGMGIFVLGVFSVFSAILFGMRAGIAAILLSIAGIGSTALGIESGAFTPGINAEVYSTALSSWLNAIAVFALFTGLTVGGLGILHRHLIGSIEAMNKSTTDQEKMNTQLTIEIAERKAAEEQLEERVEARTSDLQSALGKIEREMAERKAAESRSRELHDELVQVSRSAGMSEVATGVLHNVGNALNSVNVSAGLIYEKVKDSRTRRISDIAELLAEHENDLHEFLSTDPKGKQIPDYLSQLGIHLTHEKDELLSEIQFLIERIGHINKIVVAQQEHAKVAGVTEAVALSELLDDVLSIRRQSFDQNHVEIVRDYGDLPPIATEKAKLIQIFANLIANAEEAILQREGGEKRIVIRTTGNANEGVLVEIEDTGIGIAPEQIDEIFSFGFTTKTDGHGFGLHMSALAASDLGGALRAKSNGENPGATFQLTLPATTLETYR